MTRRERMTQSVQRVVDRHPWLLVAALVGQVLVGGGAIGLAGWMLLQNPEAWKVPAGVATFGSLVLHGFAKALAGRAQHYVGLFRAVRAAKKDSGKEGDR